MSRRPRDAETRIRRFADAEFGTPLSPRAEILVAIQAARAREAGERLRGSRVVVLGDPVGSGKTVVALAAIGEFLAGKNDRALIVVPNQTVKRIWEERAARFSVRSQVRVETLHKLAKGSPRERLVIVDEAHARLQIPKTSHDKVSHAARGKAVLLVSATPYQLTASGLITMMSVAGDDIAGDLAVVSEYASALAELAGSCARMRGRLSFAELVARPWVRRRMAALKRLRQKARAALEPHLMSSYPRGAVGIPDPPTLRAASVPLDGWELAYQTGRIVPELIGAGKGSMLQRGLLSSADQFAASAAGVELDQQHPELYAELIRRLGAAGHPKVAATVRWAASRIAEERRRIAVFCHFHATQRAIAEGLADVIGPHRVYAPSGDRIAGDYLARFTTREGDGLALVLTDRFSESIDLDGGMPCLVHHDLSWNPSRLEQRWGRLVRARTGFVPIPSADIYVPVLATALDQRMLDTVKARSDIRAAVLSDGLSTADEPGEEEDSGVLPRQLIEELLADPALPPEQQV